MSPEGVNLHQNASITSNIKTLWLCTVRLQNVYAGNEKYETKQYGNNNNNKSRIGNVWKSVIQAVKAQKGNRSIALLFL